MSRRIALVDRDGTVNVDCGYVYRAEDWRFAEGAPQALKDLHNGGYGIALVTNQSGVGRGYYTLQDVAVLHTHVRRLLAAHGVHIDAVAVCPHTPDDACQCRKPASGLARQIEGVLGASIDYPNSWTIGDKLSDLQFGQALGTHTALIRGRYWTPPDLVVYPDIIADSLAGAVQQILRRGKQPT